MRIQWEYEVMAMAGMGAMTKVTGYYHGESASRLVPHGTSRSMFFQDIEAARQAIAKLLTER